MRILVATSQTQGTTPSDFCFANEGEVVIPGVVCGSALSDPRHSCGCERSFIGINTRQGTTTMKVIDADDMGTVTTFETLLDAVMLAETVAGMCDDPQDPEWRIRTIDNLERMLDRVCEFPLGTILVYNLYTDNGQLMPRFIPPDAPL